MQIKNLLLLFLAISICSNTYSIQYPSYSKVLRNGLKVIVCEKPGNEFVQVELWYRVGSKDEKPGIRGMAHLFEHMMFRGTEKYPGNAYFDNIDEIGGTTNAYTSFDKTVYWSFIPKSNLDILFEMEADRMNNLLVTQQILDIEREVVGEELRIGQNNWFLKMYKERYSFLYPQGHPYEVDIIGNMNEILTFTDKQCMEFYNNYYSPDNAFLIVIGNVKSTEVFNSAGKYFEIVTKKIISEPLKNNASIFNAAIKKNDFTIDYPLQIYSFIFPMPEASNKDHLPLTMLVDMLLLNDNSILKTRLMKKDYLVFDIISANEQFNLFPQWYICDVVMAAQPGNIRVKKIVKEETNKIIEFGFPADVYVRYIKSIDKEQIFEDYTAANIALKLGIAEYYFNDYKKAYTLKDDIKKVTTEQLQSVAKKYLSEEKLQFINIKP